VRISRPCFDKPHRCPGWAGGGMRYAKVDRCDSGRLTGLYEKRMWKWRFNRCDTCDVLALPYAVQYVDPRWWSYAIRRAARDARYWMETRR
jgi:hypothetical protein